MKKLALLFFFSIFFLNSQGQTSVYHPFPDSDAVWREFSQGSGSSGCCCSGIVCVNEEEYEYFIDGDTVIGSYSYKKILRTGTGKYYISGPHFCPTWCTGCDCYSFYREYVGAIRQDTSQKRIFYIPYSVILESLLYDFNLKVGDTLSPSFINSWITTVSSIDSILIGASYNKRFWLSTGSAINFTSIIEGIGNTYGLLSDLHPPFEFVVHLQCVTINSITVYPDTATFCPLASNIEEKNFSRAISLFPNPASNKITIINYSFSGKEARVEIYNMMGEKVQTINFKPESAVDVSNLAAGVYLVEVGDVADSPGRGEKMWRGKMVKE